MMPITKSPPPTPNRAVIPRGLSRFSSNDREGAGSVSDALDMVRLDEACGECHRHEAGKRESISLAEIVLCYCFGGSYHLGNGMLGNWAIITSTPIRMTKIGISTSVSSFPVCRR